MFDTETRTQTVSDTMSYRYDEHQRLGEDDFLCIPTEGRLYLLDEVM